MKISTIFTYATREQQQPGVASSPASGRVQKQ